MPHIDFSFAEIDAILSSQNLPASVREKLTKPPQEHSDRVDAIINIACENGVFQDGVVELHTCSEGQPIVSEGEDNGCYVQAWAWVNFEDTPLDKETEEEEIHPQ